LSVSIKKRGVKSYALVVGVGVLFPVFSFLHAAYRYGNFLLPLLVLAIGY